MSLATHIELVDAKDGEILCASAERSLVQRFSREAGV